MDILNQITAVPNIHAYLLLQSRGLSSLRIRHTLLLASSSILRAYAASSQQQQDEGIHDTTVLQYKVDIRDLAARLDFSPSFTMTLVDQLAPDVVARMHRRLRGDSTLLHQLNEPSFVRGNS
jgi:hypothetical protein